LAYFSYVYIYIVAVAFFLASFFFILLVFKIRAFLEDAQGTLRKVTETLDEANHTVQSVSLKGEEVLSNLNQTLTAMNERLDRLENEVVDTLHKVNTTLDAACGLESTVEETINKTINKIDPIIESTKSVARDLEFVGNDIRRKVDQTSNFFDAAEEAATTARSVTEMVRSGVLGAAVEVVSLAAGVKTSIEYLAKRLEQGGTKS